MAARKTGGPAPGTRGAKKGAKTSVQPARRSGVKRPAAASTKPVPRPVAKSGTPAATPSAAKRSATLATLEHVYVSTRTAWREWLGTHHDRSPGIWLVFDRKSSRSDRLAYGDAVEEALCFGWIDSTVHPIDTERYEQLFTPRKPKSVWSRTNKDRVARLIADGLMTPAGVAKIDEAKRIGSWSALDAVEAMVIPPDLDAALAANPTAHGHFHAFSPSTRKGYLYWLNGAKRPEARMARLTEIVRLAAANRRTRG